jgi:hypothetical protein
LSRPIATASDLDSLHIGSVVVLVADGETMNVALKTPYDEWGLAGQVSRFASDKLFSLAVNRDGYTLTVVHEP